MIHLRDYQTAALEQVRDAYRTGHRTPLLVAPTGCHAKGTLILTHDGRQIPVENIQAGDQLMGPDSTPRTVLSLHRGIDELYRIQPTKGEPFTVNGDHLLSLVHTETRAHVVISVRDWLSRTKWFRHCHKLWRVGVEYPPQPAPLPMDPYILGVFLGDGCITTTTAVCNPDPEIIQAMREYAESCGVSFRTGTYSERCPTHSFGARVRHGRDNPVRAALQRLGVFGKTAKEKGIPYQYLTASRRDRAALLAGLLDTDGYLLRGGYEIATASNRMAENILQLARSLGLSANIAPKTVAGHRWVYWRLHIFGDTTFLPMRLTRKIAAPRRQKKDVLVTGFRVDSVGPGVYYGFECDQDHLYLTGDFTVHHNSGKTTIFCFVAHQAAAKGNPTLILAHRAELIRQTSATLDRFEVAHGLIAPGEPETDALVQVASVQTLVRRLNRLSWAPGLVICDEAHHCTRATGHGRILAHFPAARVLGVTATPARLDGRGLGVAVGGYFDALVLGPTVRELVDAGHLSRPVVYAPPTRPDLSGIRTVAGDFDKGALAAAMDKPTITGDAVAHYARLCQSAPAIAFCTSLAHAEHVAAAFRAAGFQAASIDGTLDDRTRRQRIEDLGAGRLNVLTSCELIGEGVDVPIVAAALLLRPTKSLALFLQQVGRALRPFPGKDRALILDHVGNVHRHGLPDDEREWSLTSEKHHRRKTPRPALRECPACGCAHQPAPWCPSCGHRYPVQSRQVEEVAGELTEVDRTAARLLARREQGQAKTLDELRALASRRGYRPGWAERVHRARQASAPPLGWRILHY